MELCISQLLVFVFLRLPVFLLASTTALQGEEGVSNVTTAGASINGTSLGTNTSYTTIPTILPEYNNYTSTVSAATPPFNDTTSSNSPNSTSVVITSSVTSTTTVNSSSLQPERSTSTNANTTRTTPSVLDYSNHTSPATSTNSISNVNTTDESISTTSTTTSITSPVQGITTICYNVTCKSTAQTLPTNICSSDELITINNKHSLSNVDDQCLYIVTTQSADRLKFTGITLEDSSEGLSEFNIVTTLEIIDVLCYTSTINGSMTARACDRQSLVFANSTTSELPLSVETSNNTAVIIFTTASISTRANWTRRSKRAAKVVATSSKFWFELAVAVITDGERGDVADENGLNDVELIIIIFFSALGGFVLVALLILYLDTRLKRRKLSKKPNKNDSMRVGVENVAVNENEIDNLSHQRGMVVNLGNIDGNESNDVRELSNETETTPSSLPSHQPSPPQRDTDSVYFSPAELFTRASLSAAISRVDESMQPITSTPIQRDSQVTTADTAADDDIYSLACPDSVGGSELGNTSSCENEDVTDCEDSREVSSQRTSRPLPSLPHQRLQKTVSVPLTDADQQDTSAQRLDCSDLSKTSSRKSISVPTLPVSTNTDSQSDEHIAAKSYSISKAAYPNKDNQHPTLKRLTGGNKVEGSTSSDGKTEQNEKELISAQQQGDYKPGDTPHKEQHRQRYQKISVSESSAHVYAEVNMPKMIYEDTCEDAKLRRTQKQRNQGNISTPRSSCPSVQSRKAKLTKFCKSRKSATSAGDRDATDDHTYYVLEQMDPTRYEQPIEAKEHIYQEPDKTIQHYAEYVSKGKRYSKREDKNDSNVLTSKNQQKAGVMYEQVGNSGEQCEMDSLQVPCTSQSLPTSSSSDIEYLDLNVTSEVKQTASRQASDKMSDTSMFALPGEFDIFTMEDITNILFPDAGQNHLVLANETLTRDSATATGIEARLTPSPPREMIDTNDLNNNNSESENVIETENLSTNINKVGELKNEDTEDMNIPPEGLPETLPTAGVGGDVADDSDDSDILPVGGWDVSVTERDSSYGSFDDNYLKHNTPPMPAAPTLSENHCFDESLPAGDNEASC